MPASVCPDLAAYVECVRSAVDARLSVRDTVERVVAANHRLMAQQLRLPESLRACRPDVPYTRNLVHQDAGGRFAILAIVWGPFQETSVHDHLNWCVMGVLEESVLAVDYDRLDQDASAERVELEMRAATILKAREVTGLLPPPRDNIHRIANATGRRAVTLHTYGDPGTKARVFDPKSGRVEIRDLVFHNLEP